MGIAGMHLVCVSQPAFLKQGGFTGIVSGKNNVSKHTLTPLH
jgi:hypothetical protein